jgi:DNA invertase Pin-like site-specific DNA recombinase
MGYVVAKYLRLSIEDERTGSMSIENQRLMLDKHIAKNFENPEILEFTDNGFSGTSFERPGVQQLLELVRQGAVNCIAVKDFSRFGRDSIETGYFVEQVFPLYRVRFIALGDGYDSDENKNGAGIDVMFKFLINEMYSRDLSVKIRSAKHEKMRRGEAVSKNCAFGYKLNDKRRMVVDAPAAETVRRIFALASEGITPARIAEILRLDKKPAGIRKILSDERYIGTYVAGKTKSLDVGSKKRLAVPESEWVKIPGHHEAIVSAALFAAAQGVPGKS